MNELVIIREGRANFQRQLLATVSALTLIGMACEANLARAAASDTDRPTVWIELGGQLSRLDDTQEAFSPPIMAVRPSIFSSSTPFEKLPLYGFDESGKISLEPMGTDWVLSASVQYGRSSSYKSVHQQTHPADFIIAKYGVPLTNVPPVTPWAARFADSNVRNNESHLILDFQAGKEVGLGIFGHEGSTKISAGVRFAQFNSKSNISLKSDPDWHFSTKYFHGARIPLYRPYHSNLAHLSAIRSFHGVGPTLSWNGTTPVVGSLESGEVGLDWGVNASVLFGRQRAFVHHQTTSFYHTKHAPHAIRTVVPTPVNTTHSRAHSVIVPNLGGFAGASW